MDRVIKDTPNTEKKKDQERLFPCEHPNEYVSKRVLKHQDRFECHDCGEIWYLPREDLEA